MRNLIRLLTAGGYSKWRRLVSTADTVAGTCTALLRVIPV